jgi:tetratricopeptide (TPR) repeat protein
VLTTEVLPMAEATGHLLILLDALINLGWVCQPLGEYLQAQAYQERALSLAERLGSRAQVVFLTYGHGLTAFSLGDWKEARDDFECAARLAASAERSWSSAHPSHGLGLLALAQGQEAARGSLEEAALLAERERDLLVLWWVQGALAEDDLLAGQNASAATRLVTFSGPTTGESIFVKGHLPLVAWAELELGEVQEAQARLEGVIALARQERMRPTLAEALRVQGLLLSRQGRWAEAEAALEEALALCRAMAAPYAEAKTLYFAGQLYQAKGEPKQGRERLEAALEILNTLGERLYARQVEQVLARKGDEA